jgi:hypothetical protein
MQAIERIDISNNWVTITIVFALFLLVLLKSINSQKLFEYSRAFFQKGFIEKKAEERMSFFSGFNLILYLFSILVYAILFTSIITLASATLTHSIELFLNVLVFVFGYFTLFMLLDVVLCHLLEVRNELAYFNAAKIGYSYNMALIIFPFLIITNYSFITTYLLLSIFVVVLALSIVLIFMNNKNLILNKLFYFILYICALKIAPLLIIYKITV